jgi:tRNA1Val (adenine37-N6)-methyltransferase
MDHNVLLQKGERVDFIFEGRFSIIQKKRGYRFSVDSFLLADFVDLRDRGDLIELGAGSGIISIVLGKRMSEGHIVGIEVQKQLVSIAKRNVQMNNLYDKITILQGDVRLPSSLCRPGSFSTAVFNPPYRRLHSGRVNPDPEKAVARHEILGTASDFIAAAAYALCMGGRMYAIYPSSKIAGFISQMKSSLVEPKRLRVVYSHRGVSASFILVEGIKGGGEGLDILPPFFIYNKEGGYTREMRRLFTSLASFESHGDG